MCQWGSVPSAAMYGRVYGVAVIGVEGHLIRVEAHVGRGLPALAVAGLPGTGVLDGRERVRPAVESAGLEWPLRRVVVNLSPANVRKEGPGFDLPIAMGVLAASAQVPAARLAGFALASGLLAYPMQGFGNLVFFESPKAGLEFAEAYLGPIVALRTILPPDAYEALSNQMVALSEQFNRGPAGSLVIDSDYLSVVARKR